MTRAEKSPVTRIVAAEDRFGVREFVVTLTGRVLYIRPIRTKRGGPQAMEVPYGVLHQRLVEAAVEARLREKRKARKRGGRR